MGFLLSSSGLGFSGVSALLSTASTPVPHITEDKSPKLIVTHLKISTSFICFWCTSAGDEFMIRL